MYSASSFSVISFVTINGSIGWISGYGEYNTEDCVSFGLPETISIEIVISCGCEGNDNENLINRTFVVIFMSGKYLYMIVTKEGNYHVLGLKVRYI